ncbi:MAG: DUF2442 domain-containing protein [Alphaproteobacteria bacterium]
MRRLKDIAVCSDNPFALSLEWDDGHIERADLSGLVAANRHFRRFENNPEDFSKVRVINWGHGVEWQNGLDYSAENLARIASEQQTHDGRKVLSDFMSTFHLTAEGVARALGYSTSQIKNFKSRTSSLPSSARLAIQAMQENPTILYSRLAIGGNKGQKPVKKHQIQSG